MKEIWLAEVVVFQNVEFLHAALLGVKMQKNINMHFQKNIQFCMTGNFCGKQKNKKDKIFRSPSPRNWRNPSNLYAALPHEIGGILIFIRCSIDSHKQSLHAQNVFYLKKR